MVGIGGGNDGGSIAASRMYMVRMKKKGEKIDPDELAKIKWMTCALTGEPLKPPICADLLGNLFNKQAILEYLLSSTKLPGFEHIRKLKHDVVDLKNARSTNGEQAPFICPLSEDEAKGTSARFYFIRKCGHVISENGLREIVGIDPKKKADDTKEKNCPVCEKKFSRQALIKLNPSETEVKEMKEALEQKKKTKKAEHKDASASANGSSLESLTDKSKKRSREEEHGGKGASAAIRPPTVTEEANSRAKAARSKSKIYDSLFHDDASAKKDQTHLFIRTSHGVYST